MPSIGELSSPVLQNANGPMLNFFAGDVGKLAQGTKTANNEARVTPREKADDVQQASRNPRTTPPELAGETRRSSRNAHFTPAQDSAEIRANARAARNPPSVPGGAHLGSVDILA
ncbi:MAG: hypothetical protein HQL76_00470 [Magnetococcales bacterium]|nr:hypothetical protein [Magnetococcales bacterium]